MTDDRIYEMLVRIEDKLDQKIEKIENRMSTVEKTITYSKGVLAVIGIALSTLFSKVGINL